MDRRCNADVNVESLVYGVLGQHLGEGNGDRINVGDSKSHGGKPRSELKLEESNALIAHVRVRGSRGWAAARGHPIPICPIIPSPNDR